MQCDSMYLAAELTPETDKANQNKVLQI